MKQKDVQILEESLNDMTNTGLYFEWVNSKGLEVLQQEILKHVRCKDCGWCCSSCNVLLLDEDVIRLCKYLGIKFEEFYDKYMDKETVLNYLVFPCPFIDTNKGMEKCKVYDARPKVCRTFPFNGSLLNIDPCFIGKDIMIIIDEKIAENILRGYTKKELEKKLINDKKRAERVVSAYDKFDILMPQFNYVKGHMLAVVDKELLEKVVKILRNR